MKKIFDGRLLKLFTGQRRLPNGIKCYLEEIRHPGASLVVPFLGKKIIFIRQFRPVIGKYIWELPAGTLEPGEKPSACAKRETAEETGYSVVALSKIGEIYTTPGFCTERIHVFRAECSGREYAKGDADELIRVKLFTKAEIRKMFAAGKINDSKTICALSFADII